MRRSIINTDGQVRFGVADSNMRQLRAKGKRNSLQDYSDVATGDW